eukprot:15011619-Ditylum_brightwellii.AAC.1
MRQWLKVNEPYIQHCLKVYHQQKDMHTADIQAYGEYRPSTRVGPPKLKQQRRHRTDTFMQESIDM